jgi:hypothetical protein
MRWKWWINKLVGVFLYSIYYIMVRRSNTRKTRKSCRKGMRGRKIMGGRKRKTFRRKSTRRRRRRGGRFKKSKRAIEERDRACSKTFIGQDRTNSKACLAAKARLGRRRGSQPFKKEEEEEEVVEEEEELRND